MADSASSLYAMDPATTLYTFFLKTDPSIRSVRLIGSWDNFNMSYAMERDSRREGGQWRGCHTFKDIICDGDASSASSTSIARKRSGGLKQGSTYYYYYEVDADTETHNPALPSTTACPYLPGQRVNTLDVPTEVSTRQRSASVSSARRSDFKTMNPADKFVTPRPPPATPSVAPASGPGLVRERRDKELRAVSSLSALRRPLSPLPSPRKLLRHQRSVRSISPAPSISAPSITAPSISAPSFSTWSPRRFFARRASPSREVTNADELNVDGDAESDYFGTATVDADDSASIRFTQPTRLPSSSSSISTGSRLRYAAIAPSSQGSRSRDISPESLRRFLVDDDVDTPKMVNTQPTSVFDTTETETETDDDDMDFEMDYDDANFATSAASENAPFTVLSPPPPSRNATPVNLGLQMQQRHQRQESTPVLTLRTSIPPPVKPSRAAPSVPVDSNTIQNNLARMSLGLEMPSSMSPTSPASISSMSSLSPMSQSDADDDDECYGTAGEPAALFLPPPQHPFGTEPFALQKHRHHLFDATYTGSTETLVPGNGLITAPNGGGLNELVDELGWMATAIRD